MKRKRLTAVVLAAIMCLTLFAPHISAEENLTADFKAIYATGKTPEGQTCTNLTDGSKLTKWCVEEFHNTDVYVIIKASRRIVPEGYSFRTGDDNQTYKGRNPKSWKIYGSNNYDETNRTADWTLIESVENDTKLQDKKWEKYSFTIAEKSEPYQYFKLEITEIKGADPDVMQLSEMDLVYTIPEQMFRAVEGSEAGNPDENYANLFDGKKTSEKFTKYCIETNDNNIYVVVEAAEPVIVTGYTFVTGNDTSGHTGRNPKSWALYGSDNYGETEVTWTKIDSVENDTRMQNVDFTPYNYTFENNRIFTYYKFEFTEDQGANLIQLCEIEFDYSTDFHNWEINSEKDPQCTEDGYIIRTCKDCGRVQEKVIPALGHDWEEISRTEDCFESGELIENCKVCGAERKTVLQPIGHSQGDGDECRNCGKKIIEVRGKYYCNLQDAVGQALSTDTVKILQNIAINDTLTITNVRTIDLNGCTIKKVNEGSVIYVRSNKLTLKDLSEARTGMICGGSAIGGGGVDVGENAEFNMEGGTISGCTAQGEGGGIYVRNTGRLNMSGGAAVENCTAKRGGGLVVYGKATIAGGKIKNCKSLDGSGGGGIYANGIYGSGNVELSSESVIENCTAKGGGGGIYANDTTVDITDSYIKNNSAAYGAGVYGTSYNEIKASMTITLNNSEISENTASDIGGALYLGTERTSAEITGGSITHNTAKNGAGIYSYSSALKINSGDIGYNKATGNGGGIYMSSGTVSIGGGSVAVNESEGNGGGIYVGQELTGGAVLNVTGGGISGNTAGGNGGGIWISENAKNKDSKPDLNVTSGDIDNNKAQIGAGIYIGSGVKFDLKNAAVRMNGAKENAGGIYFGGEEFTVSETPMVNMNVISAGESELGEGIPTDSNIYLPTGKILTITGDGLKPHVYPYGYVEEPKLWVTAENGTGDITAECDDCSEYFNTDNIEYAVAYDGGVIKLVKGYRVTFEYSDKDRRVSTVVPNHTVAEPESVADRIGYTFVGWLLDGEDYDFATPVTGDITLTPKWVENGKKAVSINYGKFYVIDFDQNDMVYLAAYKNGVLIDSWVHTFNENDSSPYSESIAKTGLNTLGADKISVFLWDGDMTPLCQSADIELKK